MYSIITPFRITLLFIIVVVGGLLVLPKLKVDLLPQKENTYLNVTFYVQNSSPEMVEQQATSILEGSFSQLAQVKKITSTSGYNYGSITLLFDKNTDMQFKQLELATLIRRVYGQLPQGVTYPLISGGNNQNNNSPFLGYTVDAPHQAFAIKKETEIFFSKALATLPGIANVSVSGSENLQITIQYDLNKCQAWGITPGSINASLQAYAAVSYPGSISTTNGAQLFLHIRPSVNDLRDVENILLIDRVEQPLRLKDIARVFIEEEEAQAFFRINGKNSVNLRITAHEEQNTIELAKQVKGIIQQTAKQLPQGYAISLAYDETEYLEKEIQKNFRRTCLSVAILILFLLFSYRSWRHPLILFSGLFVNLSLSAILVYLFCVNIHLYSIAGLSVAFGIITDNAIVMIDYYRQWRNRKIFPALLASTLITVTALSLVFFLPAEDRNNLGDFSLVIVLTLASSMLVALWFTPALYELVIPLANTTSGKKQTACKRIYKLSLYYNHVVRFIARFRKSLIVLLVLLFGLPVFMLPDRWKGNQWYHRWYNNSIGTATYQENIRNVTDKWLGGTLRMFVTGVNEKGGYRSPDATRLYVHAELPYGNTIEQMNNVLIHFEKYLNTVDGIDKYITNIYSGQKGSIEISFKAGYENTGLPYELKSKLIASSLDWGGLEWNIYGAGQGFTNKGDEEVPNFKVTLKGYNYDELEKQANRLAEKLLKHKRIQKLNTNDRIDYAEKPGKDYILKLDETKIALAGTNQFELLQSVAAVSKPLGVAQNITLGNKYYPVVLKEIESEKFSSYNLLNDLFNLDSNRQVRLKDFSKLVLQTTASSIHKIDRQYIRIVSFEYMGAEKLGNKCLDDILAEMKKEMPVGYTATKNSWHHDWEKTRQQYLLIFLVILANFFICSILFENLKKPFYIIAMIPVSFIGLFLIFPIGNFYFDQGGYAAFMVLGGLIANAAIFIVNDFNNLQKRFPRRNYNNLLIKATINRSRTILLTTISTCCGMIPFLLEGQNEVFWFSLAIGTIGGLVFSLFAVFIILPVLLWKNTNK